MYLCYGNVKYDTPRNGRTMLVEFLEDLKKAKTAEELVLKVFSSLTIGYNFTDVSEDRACYYKGDIKATDWWGNKTYIEVKDDSRIADTKNVLCEDEVFFKESCYYDKGNMSSNYDIYVVVSQKEKKMYVIDFDILKSNYRKGEYKEINHPHQITYCYLCSLGMIKRWGGLIETIDYSGLI